MPCIALLSLNLLLITSSVIRGLEARTYDFCSLYGSAGQKEIGPFPENLYGNLYLYVLSLTFIH